MGLCCSESWSKSSTVSKQRGFYFNLVKGEILRNTWIFISLKENSRC
ncbi:hypothetical protein PVAP13_8NG154202 [Panicum virgatum]|uniref:Uncharacterized protein n=1 Tax=Panicum virgatum TaxID=38727 RepID=A0A8T0P7N4_PANVG|nr:hypothetical protein PVAP13_8NG154202 [Panicum virgatum]